MTGGCTRQRQLSSSMLCQGNCDDDEQQTAHSNVNIEEPSHHLNRPFIPADDQPEPDTVPDTVDEESTDRDEMMAEEQYPQRTEFVVHVEQEPDMSAASSEPAEQLHHHQHHDKSESTASSGRRRHHRLACWDYEARERQCLNGGQCFAIQLHNGIRRSGCRLVCVTLRIYTDRT